VQVIGLAALDNNRQSIWASDLLGMPRQPIKRRCVEYPAVIFRDAGQMHNKPENAVSFASFVWRWAVRLAVLRTVRRERLISSRITVVRLIARHNSVGVVAWPSGDHRTPNWLAFAAVWPCSLHSPLRALDFKRAADFQRAACAVTSECATIRGKTGSMKKETEYLSKNLLRFALGKLPDAISPIVLSHWPRAAALLLRWLPSRFRLPRLV
jgi:hypothetical protein